MLTATVFDLVPSTPAALERPVGDDLAPPRRWGAAGLVGAYVACHLRDGRALFDVLADEFVQERVDEQPDLLGALAADTQVRDELACGVFPPPPLAVAA